MAKPIGPKSLLIRQAITAHPDKTPKELAELLNDSHDRMDDKLKFTPNDISQQKQAMKKPGATTAPAAAPAAAASPEASRERQAEARSQAGEEASGSGSCTSTRCRGIGQPGGPDRQDVRAGPGVRRDGAAEAAGGSAGGGVGVDGSFADLNGSRG